MFSRKPKERRVPEVNVLPTPVLVPPEVPLAAPEEASAAEVVAPVLPAPPAGEESHHSQTSA